MLCFNIWQIVYNVVMIIKKIIKENKPEIEIEKPLEEVEEVVNVFDLDNIDFAQRQERRRGDRRRGYRRIDDRSLISRAQEEAHVIKDNASLSGYQEGIAKAQEDIDALREMISTFFDAKEQVFREMAPSILEISLDIARKIIKTEVTQDPNSILETIEDVLNQQSKEESKIIIRANPNQVDLIKAEAPTIALKVGCDAKITVIADDSIDFGGCRFYMSNGVVDATIETQLEIIKEALKDI